MSNTNPPLKYIKEFDGLRAVAILGVMFSHFLGQYRLLVQFGSSGVTLFFVLSGYLITQILLEEKEKHGISYSNTGTLWPVLKTFYTRRSLRIFPIYILTIAVLIILNVDSVRQYALYYFFYLSNFLYSFTLDFDHLSHLWSLAVEEQFYLVWPFLILLAPRHCNWRSMFTGLIIFSLLFKCVLFFALPANRIAAQYMMPSCIESFAMGSLVLALKTKTFDKNTLASLAILGLLVFATLQLLAEYSANPIFVTVNALFSRLLFSFSCAIVLLLITKKMDKGVLSYVLKNNALVLLGKISYGVYLYHIFVPGILLFLQRKFQFNLAGSGINLLLHFAVSFLIAWISFRLIETPINNLKRKFTYS